MCAVCLISMKKCKKDRSKFMHAVEFFIFFFGIADKRQHCLLKEKTHKQYNLGHIEISFLLHKHELAVVYGYKNKLYISRLK